MEPFRFTKAKLLELPPAPKGKQIEYYDTHVRGLRLRVGASGIKAFCVVRKVKNKFYRTVIGRFPEVSVEMARSLALEKLGDISISGKNPNVARREAESASVLLKDALALYIRTRGHRLKATTAIQYERLLQNFSGDWQERPLANITRDDVFDRHKAITEGSVWFGSDRSKLRAGVGTGSKAQADLWGRALRAVFNFAHDNYRDAAGKKLIPEPPTKVLSTKRQWHGLKRKSTRIRNHDLGRWLRAVDAVRNEANESIDEHTLSVCDALDMALFTGLRRGEVFSLEWDRVNLKGRYFWIDKTKNGHPLELPITNTLEIIFNRRLENRKNNNKYVFPALRGGKITDPRTVIEKIERKTSQGEFEGEVPISFTCHDARRTFASIADMSGVGIYMLKRLMNHKSGATSDTTQGYVNFSVEELIEPAKKIEEKIKDIAMKTENNIWHSTLELLGGLDKEKQIELVGLIKNFMSKDNI